MIRFLIKKTILLLLKADNQIYKLISSFGSRLENNGLNPKHRIMNYHDWFCSRVQSEWIVLDIGCGNGALSYDLAKNCRQVLGIDYNQNNIQKARQLYQTENTRYHCINAETYKPECVVDCVVLSNVLEHITERTALLKKIFFFFGDRPVRILLRVPQLDREWITLYKKEMGVEWRLDRSHTTEYTYTQLSNELAEAGLSIIETEQKFGEFYIVATAASMPP